MSANLTVRTQKKEQLGREWSFQVGCEDSKYKKSQKHMTSAGDSK